MVPITVLPLVEINQRPSVLLYLVSLIPNLALEWGCCEIELLSLLGLALLVPPLRSEKSQQRTVQL